jgi:hypothetical protein
MRINVTSHLANLNHSDDDLGILKRQQAPVFEFNPDKTRLLSSATILSEAGLQDLGQTMWILSRTLALPRLFGLIEGREDSAS